MEYKRIGLDTSKHVFTLHGVDAAERCVLRRDLKRGQLDAFFAKLPPTEVALEACGSAHHWGRWLEERGHSVRLLPPQYVKPYVKRGKTDRHDAAAICEAASRPDMRFVPVKSAEQQADAMLLRVRELLVTQRTQLVNALRGHAAEFGLVVGRGVGRVSDLLERIAASAMPPSGQAAIGLLAAQLAAVEAQLADADKRLQAQHKANETSRRLAAMPGVGWLTALSVVLTVRPEQFESGRHFAAWLGLTPREHASGGRPRPGGISRAGNERLRQLLVLGATAVIRYVRPDNARGSAWLRGLLARRPRKVAAVALANKMARMLWAMLARGEAYRPATVAA